VIVSGTLALAAACDEPAEGQSGAKATPRHLELSAEALANAELGYAEAGPANLATRFSRSGDLAYDRTRLAKLVSRIPGVVESVQVKEGDPVKAGAVVAVIRSRKLADLKLTYLERVQRFGLARRLFQREKKLLDRGVTTKDAYLKRKKSFDEAGLALHLAKQRLRVVGVNASKLSGRAAKRSLDRYEVRTPFAGTVLSVKVTVGSAVTDAQPLIRLADLARVWGVVRVPTHRLAGLKVGQRVPVSNRRAGLEGEGRLIYIAPEADRATRTVLVRLAIANPEGRWRPGISITARFQEHEQRVAVAVPRSAVHELGGHPVVFVKTSERHFEVRRVWTGPKGAERVAIRKGLRAGERVATENSFALKAEYQNREGG
jgi:cobalt-zinc-cadmium efflux system membrane fusion protein